MRNIMSASGQALFLAQNKKTNLHAAIWLVSKACWDVPTVTVTPDLYNGLMGAKNVDMLLMGMEPLGPLTHDECFKPSAGSKKREAERRVFSVEEAIRLLSKDYGPSNETLLYRETFLYPFAVEGEKAVSIEDVDEFEPDTNKSATRRAIARFDAFRNDLVLQLKKLDDKPNYVVCIEALQEWQLVRNSLSVCSALYAASLDVEKRDEPLKGFIYSPRQHILKCACYYVPYAFNTFWRSDSTAKTIIDDFTRTIKLVNPLRDIITESPKDRQHAKPLLHYWMVLRGNDDVCFLSAPQATGKGFGFKKVDDTEDLATYLVLVEQDGEGQQEVASRAFKAFEDVLFRGQGGYRDRLLFGSAGVDGRDEGEGDSLVGYGSLIAALWGTMLHHRGFRLVTCDRCHNTVLSSNKGARTRFCSSSCRSASSKENRERSR